MFKHALIWWSILFSLTACIGVGPTIVGPSNFDDPPKIGWTRADVIQHWGLPDQSSFYQSGTRTYETLLYSRRYWVIILDHRHIETEYTSLYLEDDRVVGISR